MRRVWTKPHIPSVATVAREVTHVLNEKGYKVRVQDYDFQLGTSLVGERRHHCNAARCRLVPTNRAASYFSTSLLIRPH